MREFIIFDFEVFKHDWGVAFYHPSNGSWTEFRNDPDGLKAFIENHKESVFVGFNNKHYDNWILYAILLGIDPYEVSYDIVINKKKPYQIDRRLYWYKGFISADMKMEIRDNLSLSLKEAEANMGMDIEETPIDFMMDRKLTPAEFDQVMSYCRHDVLATYKIFQNRLYHIESRLTMMRLFDWPLTYMEKTGAQLTAIALDAKRPENDYVDKYIYEAPPNLDIRKNTDLVVAYENQIEDEEVAITKQWRDLELVFGIGGVHGAIPKYIGEDVILIDVSSYYPNLMIKYNYVSRSIKDQSKFKQIVDYRLDAKAKSDKVTATALKNIIVAPYGAMDFKFSELYDPRMRRAVSITGQLFLVDLMEKLEPYCTIVQANTDGVMVKLLPGFELKDIYPIVQEWEQRTQLEMEWTIAKKLYQKDVNNYVLIMDDGSIKVKGAYVKQYKGGNYARKHLVIVDKAVVDYFANGTPIEETIYNNWEEHPDWYQIIAKQGPTFEKTITYVDNKPVEIQKVNRLFATTNIKYGGIFKIKEGSQHKVANTPENSYVYNGDMRYLDKDKVQLDFEYYLNLAKQRIKDFTGEEYGLHRGSNTIY